MYRVAGAFTSAAVGSGWTRVCGGNGIVVLAGEAGGGISVPDTMRRGAADGAGTACGAARRAVGKAVAALRRISQRSRELTLAAG